MDTSRGEGQPSSASAASGLFIYRTSAENPLSPREKKLVCVREGRPWLRGVHDGERVALLFQPRCGLWSCPACGEINRRLWVARAYAGVAALAARGERVSFLTLTSHERLSGGGSLAVWPSGWKKLRERASYAAGGFEYLAVPERHQDGRLHVHALETSGLGSRWWKDNARACGLGYMAEERAVDGAAGAAWYVSKYLGKTLGAGAWPAGFHRVRVSRGWPRLPLPDEAEGWRWGRLGAGDSVQRAAARLEARGYRVLIADHAAAWFYVGELAAGPG